LGCWWFLGDTIFKQTKYFFLGHVQNEKYLPEANSSIILQRPCTKLPISSRIQNETR
jgi:hypothetical protein